jgi:hypothetical protein
MKKKSKKILNVDGRKKNRQVFAKYISATSINKGQQPLHAESLDFIGSWNFVF